jgi:hypothetical protein
MTQFQDPTQRIRLTVEIREDQRVAMNQLIPWGCMKPLFEHIIDDLILMLKENGSARTIALILTEKISPSQCMPSLSMGKEASK